MRILLIILLVALSGCVTWSGHTKKADKNRYDLAYWLEAYANEDADTERKQFIAEQIGTIKNEAEKILGEDPSAVSNAASKGIGLLGMLGLGGSGLGVVGMALQFLRSNKMKHLVDELISQPDEKECLKIAKKYRHA